jgi:hypothetical protein
VSAIDASSIQKFFMSNNRQIANAIRDQIFRPGAS